MPALRAVAMSLMLTAILAGAVCAQHDGATITFTDTKTLIYEGTGEVRAETPAARPVTVGNLRITGIRLPAQANRDHVGLVIPFRGALSERMVNLDPRWGGPGTVALLCEVIDPDEPIGFRLRAHARVRMFHSPGAWLELNLGRGARDNRAVPAAAQTKRFSGETHAWYVLSSIDEIHRRDDPDTDRFAILLSTGERGSWWIKSLELKAWPTTAAQ